MRGREVTYDDGYKFTDRLSSESSKCLLASELKGECDIFDESTQIGRLPSSTVGHKFS
jgi:hypothetical protein